MEIPPFSGCCWLLAGFIASLARSFIGSFFGSMMSLLFFWVVHSLNAVILSAGSIIVLVVSFVRFHAVVQL